MTGRQFGGIGDEVDVPAGVQVQRRMGAAADA